MAVPFIHGMAQTPHGILTKDDIEVVRMLLMAAPSSNKHDIEGLDHVGKTYKKLVQNQSSSMLDILSPHHRLKPLHLAVTSFSNPDTVVKMLLLLGNNPNVRNRNEETPLHIAASSRGHDIADTIRLLIEYGADTDARDAHLQTPLHRAQQEPPSGGPQVKIIYETLPNPYLRNLLGSKPLHTALYHRHLRVVRRLLAYGAELTEGKAHWPMAKYSKATPNNTIPRKKACDTIHIGTHCSHWHTCTTTNRAIRLLLAKHNLTT